MISRMKIVAPLSVPALCIAALAIPGCSSVPPYSRALSPPDVTLVPPSTSLAQYDEKGLSAQLERTTMYCGRVKQALAREIDERNQHSTAVHQWLVGTGSVAGIATTIYSGVAKKPHKEVVVPLGAISGTSLVSALPSFGKDDRAEALQQKIATIRAKENAVLAALATMEHGMTDLGLLNMQLGRAPTKADSQTVLLAKEKKYVELQPAEDQLRGGLLALANECN